MKLRVGFIRYVTTIVIGLSTIWLVVVYRQKSDIKRKIHERNFERNQIVSELVKIRKHFQGQVPPKLVSEMIQLEQNLKSNNHHLTSFDTDEKSCHLGHGLVPDEVYTGSGKQNQEVWYEGAWILNNTTPVSHKLEDLITILLVYKGNNLNEFILKLKKNLKIQYSNVKVIVGATTDKPNFNHNEKKIEVVISQMSESQMWSHLLQKVSTEYVLVGRDIDLLHEKWINLERSIRLLNAYGDKFYAVGGSTRNSSGHWKANCYQADVRYYNLILEPGYKSSTCDCMICTALWKTGPFVARKADLAFQSDLSPDLMFLSWFLQMKLDSNFDGVLACPDILYVTSESHAEIKREDWKALSKIHRIGSVSILDQPPTRLHTFSCEDAGLSCSPADQADAYLVPWCCIQNYNYILSVVDEMADKLGFHYEIDSGSLLGGVKLNNFIPWDIDGDLYIDTKSISLFDKDGPGAKAFSEAGIGIFGRKENNYWDIGAGYFQVSYGGVNFEMMGKRSLTLNKLPEPGLPPTRVQVGDTWCRAHTHPGEYLRGRYGPGYLKHIQAWRFVESMSSAFEYGRKNVRGWNLCPNPGDHACLERYPDDGNIDLLPHKNL